MTKPSESELEQRSREGRPSEAADEVLFELTPARTCRCGRSHVSVSGELDLAGIDRLTKALEWLRLDGNRRLVVDVSEIRFLSATGLGALVRAARSYADAGGSLTLTRPTSMIDRLLTATGLHQVLVGEPDPRCDTHGPLVQPRGGRERADGAAARDAERGTERDDTVYTRISSVLAGMTFPAMRWQLLTQADYYGADHYSRTDLAALPEGRYADLAAVHQALRKARRRPGDS